MSQSYCARCKSKTHNISEHLETSMTGRRLLKSTCSVCGAKKSSFAPGVGGGKPRGKKSSKQGGGFFSSFIPAGIGRTMDNLANGAIGITERVAVPVATSLLRSKMGGSARSRRV